MRPSAHYKSAVNQKKKKKMIFIVSRTGKITMESKGREI